MKRERMRFTGPVLIAVVIGVIIWANAGDLMPPAGAPSPTMKTLTQVEPRTPVQTLSGDGTASYIIDQPGSYYLTGNITGESGKDGIRIDASSVTLDLNGFALIGVTGSGAGVQAAVAGYLQNLTIRNGTVRDWGGDGVEGTVFAQNSQAKGLRIYGNGSDGLGVGSGWVITGCTVTTNGGCGIRAHSACLISGCTASNNYGGIDAGLYSTITDCTAKYNITYGIYGADGCTISNCTAAYNYGDGIRVGSNCLVVGNTCGPDNGDIVVDFAGIHVEGQSNRIEGNNVCGNNDPGIYVSGTQNLIIKNSARGNAPMENYRIVADNSYGPIVNVGGVGDISGTPNADHPWANFEH